MARFELQGKVALVTGAARGIGLATATELARKGARVVVVDLDQEAADRAAEVVGSGAVGVAADVTDRAAMQRAVAVAVERFGGLDVVVANAGIAARVATARATPSESFERILDVNLNGVWRTVEAALPQVVARRGHVVVVASIYAFVNGMGTVAYAMSKAGVEQLGRALRVELAQHGASASVAYFGFIDTEMVHRAIDADDEVGALLGLLPRPLLRRLAPSVAGTAIVRGIERRRPRVIRPRAWVAWSVLRGIVNPVADRLMERDARIQGAMRRVDAREGEEQPTTA
ncbi:short-chain dehydrogenase/reductase [Conexibacter sp. SYSU D00693]|uniref:short-chain dehydrogenase/reductase n=1 Tax=Conexibacter sp. SYSU D00693 TaxID=2812560 RepID=UPI00196B0048|nr:short-chain dehydrogenase/reductase [Conexibacter sp. SYSU D00693]